MATEEVTIPFPNTSDEFRRLYYASEFAMEIKLWLNSQGLALGTDFNWSVDPDAKEITFTFAKAAGWTSLVALKFTKP